jgi:8-oxo-dGTP pyrophosphatase MutT (NUDIX family)
MFRKIKRASQAIRSLAAAHFFRSSKFVGAGALIFDQEGRVLLIKNRWRNSWEYPAGGANGNESPYATCQREVGEEVGLHLDNYRLVGVDFWRHLTPNGNILFTFAAEVTHEQAVRLKTQAFEVSAYRWVSRADAMGLIRPRLRNRLTQLFTAYDNARVVYLQSGESVI